MYICQTGISALWTGGIAAEAYTQNRFIILWMQAGCILNGTITDEDGFREMVRNLWETSHIPRRVNVYLVIDSSQFTTKVVDVPALKPKQMMEYISR